MSSVVISGDTSGSISLAVPTVAGSNTATFPAATGTVMVSGNMPAFSAYQSTQQSTLTANVPTLLQFQTKEFDTNGCFNNTGSTVTLNGVSAPQYSFAPNVAGYYQVSGCATVAASVTYILFYIYKNGSVIKRPINTNSASITSGGGSALVYCNGTSDYIQIYCLQGANQQLVNAAEQTYFQAAMVRNA